MQNDKNESVDLYIPRKCSWTNRLLSANDFGSVQINVGKVDESTGHYLKVNDTFALCGFIRGQAEADEALTTLVKRADAISN